VQLFRSPSVLALAPQGEAALKNDVVVFWDHPSRRDVERAPHDQVPSPAALRPSRFGRRGRPKTGKAKRMFRIANERFRIEGRKSLISLLAPNHDFAQLFVFNGLKAFSFRAFFVRRLKSRICGTASDNFVGLFPSGRSASQRSMRINLDSEYTNIFSNISDI
jgi:hypothetical protein